VVCCMVVLRSECKIATWLGVECGGVFPRSVSIPEEWSTSSTHHHIATATPLTIHVGEVKWKEAASCKIAGLSVHLKHCASLSEE
jgi:hypothetical protein